MITINGAGTISGLAVGGLGAGVVDTNTLATGAATPTKLSGFNTLGNYANDAAAAAGGVAIGGQYRNGSVIQVRVA